MVNTCHSSHSTWHLALRNFIMQIKNKLNNLIVNTFLLLFVNKIMFTKCFSLLQKCFFCKMGAFLLKMCFFFPWKGALFKCFFCQSPLRSLSEGGKWARGENGPPSTTLDQTGHHTLQKYQMSMDLIS